MARLASAGWIESGRLFGEVTSANSTEERKKDVCEWDTDTQNVQTRTECQSICARNNRSGSASSYVRHLISFGTLETHSEVPFPRMGGDSDERLSEQHSDTIAGITSFYSSSSKLDLEIAQRRIHKSCGIIEADRRRKNWPVYVLLRRFAVGATDHRQETVIVATL